MYVYSIILGPSLQYAHMYQLYFCWLLGTKQPLSSFASVHTLKIKTLCIIMYLLLGTYVFSVSTDSMAPTLILYFRQFAFTREVEETRGRSKR